MTDLPLPPIRSGWVKARLRRTTRVFYLTLDSLSLFFRKSQQAAVKKEIRLTQIASLKLSEACRIDISTKAEEIRLFINPAEDCLAWAEAIKHTANTCSESAVADLADFHEAMSRIRQVLYDREVALQTESLTTFLALKEELEGVVERLSVIEASVPTLFPHSTDLSPETFRSITAATTFLSTPLPECEEMNQVSVRVSLNWAVADETIKQGIDVQYADPEQCFIKRSDATRVLKWKYSGIHFDALSFRVDKSVKLTGIILCTPAHPQTSTVVEDLRILTGRTSHSPDWYSHGAPVLLTYHPHISTQTISLKKHVIIEPDQFYTILMRVKGGSTYKCVNCRDTVQGQKGVVWNFRSTVFINPRLSNKSDVVSGPIAGVCYRSSV